MCTCRAGSVPARSGRRRRGARRRLGLRLARVCGGRRRRRGAVHGAVVTVRAAPGGCARARAACGWRRRRVGCGPRVAQAHTLRRAAHKDNVRQCHLEDGGCRDRYAWLLTR